MLKRRTPAFYARTALDVRTYRVLWKMLRIYPPAWSRAFWEPNFRLARQALRHEAAQKVRELAQLIALLRSRKLNAVVEIGTDRGGTLYAWCQLAEPEATIVSIDLPGGPFGRGVSDVAAFAKYAGPGQTLRFLSGDSHDPAMCDRLAETLVGRGIDFLMIDGDHTYEGVKRDFELYSPFVRAGGLIGFHDVLPNELDSRCGVDRFWREVRQGRQTAEFLDAYDDRGLGQWGGIGVLFWEGGAIAQDRPQGDDGVSENDQL
jgi:cephalosporin hydroxylase